MAWIPLLLAGWFVVDVLIVAIVLAVARRRRQHAATTAEPLARVGPPVRGERRRRPAKRMPADVLLRRRVTTLR